MVFLIIGLTQGFDIFFGNLERADPGDLQILAQACIGYVNQGLRTAYCTFKDVTPGTDSEYVNCEDSRLQTEIDEGITKSKFNCDSVLIGDFCKSADISKGEWDKVEVNGQTCAAITGESSKDLAITSLARCKGLASQCSDSVLNSATKCGDQKDCSWTNYVCTGSVKACDSKDTSTGQLNFNTKVLCDKQEGCSWR